MHREEDSRHIGDFFRSCLVGFYPENQNPKFQSGRHWTKLTHACFDQKIMNQPQNLMAFSPINVKRDQSILKQQLEAQYNCHFKNWHSGATVLDDYNLCIHTKRGARSSEIQLQSEMKERLKTCLICKTTQLTAHGLISTSSSFKANLVADLSFKN